MTNRSPWALAALHLSLAALAWQGAAAAPATCIKESDRVRARQLGIAPGVLPPGPLNAITDVSGVLVGHTTVVAGDSIRTGAMTIAPTLNRASPLGLNCG